jgi:LysR family carnitine catabolism transcriptional activator
MKPSVDQLQAFIALADTSHFTRAAERLGVSQSSLSATVGKLEALLGVRLFDRHTRGCRLSAAGAALLPSARRLAQDWRGLLDDARDFAVFGRGRLDIAAPGVQSALLLPPLLREFLQGRPGVRVTLHDVAEEQVHELVRSGAVDLGLSTDTGERSDLVVTPFYADQYVVAVPPEHALARRRSVEWAHLAGEPIVGPLPDNPVRRHLDARLAEAGIRLDYRHEVSLAWTMVGLVREGLGITVLTTAVRPLAEWHQLVVRPVSRPSLSRSLGLLRAPGRSLSPPAAAFRDQLLGLQREADRARR